MDTRKDPRQEFAPNTMNPENGTSAMVTIDQAAGVPMAGNAPQKSSSPLQDSMRRLRRDKRAMISIGVIIFFILLAIVGPPIYQHIGGPYTSAVNGNVYGPADYHNYFHEELNRINELPSAQYWLGTDDLGRDILARLMQGILVSLFVALMVEIVDIGLGVTMGVIAGYYGGWIDQLLARFTDLMFAFPGLLFVILIAGIFGSAADSWFANIPIIGGGGNARLILVSLALAVSVWPFMARLVRGQTLQLKEQQFIEAARTSGTKNIGIMFRHIVPNLFSIVVVAATLNISGTIIGEAGISLLGLGVQSPGSSIGLMIANGSALVQVYPWEVMVPSVVLALIVLAFSFLGDGLRDAFDPRSKD